MKKIKKKSSSLNLIYTQIRKKTHILFFIFLFSIFTVGLNSFSPIVYKVIIDDIISIQSTTLVVFYVAVLILIPILVMIISYIKDRLIYNFSSSISEKLRRNAYKACLNMVYESFEKIGYQKALKVVTREIGRICDVFIFGELLSVINSSLQLVITFILLLTLNWKLALACLMIFPILFLIVSKTKSSVGSFEKKLMQVLSKGDNYLTQAFIGIKTIKSHNAQTYELKEFEKWLLENRNINWKVKSSHTFARNILPNIVQQVAYGLLFVLCAYLVMENQMTMGTLIAVVAYIPIIFSAMNSLLGTKIGYESVKSSISDLDELLDSEQEAGSNDELNYDNLAIEIDKLDFEYERNDFNLFINELTVKKGEFLAIVGESGSGKSALFDVLCRFYTNWSGSVKIYGNDVRCILPETLHDIIRLTSQNVVLWNKTIEENIIYPASLENMNKEKYAQCIHDAGLTGFLETLTYGDKTLLGDFGSQISGGEKQRIAFARSLYSDYEILLLDEPTAALDSITSQIIFDTILREKEKGKTIVLVTHDILKSTIADKIIVMQNGKIIENGSPIELLGKSTQFQKLYQSGLKNYNSSRI